MSFRTLVAVGAVLFATPVFADGIEVHDAYAIAALPTSVSGAAFMTIHNHGGAADRLIGLRSDAAERMDLHANVETDGVMQMVSIADGIDLPVNGQIVLSRGADHIMMLGLTEPFVDGTVFTLTLEFEVAGDVVVEVPVDLKRVTGDAMDHGGMDMNSMDMTDPISE